MDDPVGCWNRSDDVRFTIDHILSIFHTEGDVFTIHLVQGLPIAHLVGLDDPDIHVLFQDIGVRNFMVRFQ